MKTLKKPKPLYISPKTGRVAGAGGKSITIVQQQFPPRGGEFFRSLPGVQARIILIMKLLIPLADFMNKTYKNLASKLTGFNKVFNDNLRDAVTGVYPGLAVDYSKLHLTKGTLPNAASAAASSVVAGKLIFAWEDNSGEGKAESSDKAFVAAYCEELNHWIFKLNSAARKAGVCCLDVDAFRGKCAQTYIGFMSADGVRTANSLYTGMVRVEIPDHVDPPFRFMLTHHSEMMTHPIFDGFVERDYSIPGC